MRAIVDTNVVLDVLLEREPFVKPAVEVFRFTEESRIVAFICATTVTTIDYLLVKSLQKPNAGMPCIDSSVSLKLPPLTGRLSNGRL